MLSHSIAGGTGSGLGSWILENIPDSMYVVHKAVCNNLRCVFRDYKMGVQSFSVFPSDKSEVVVQPYNSVLTLSRLYDFTDMTVVLDNEAMNKIAMDKMKIVSPSMRDTNAIIGRIMGGLTAPIRFGSPAFGSFCSIASHLAPVHPLHFIQCGMLLFYE